MPRTATTLKELCIETTLFIVIVTVVAHISIYYWERLYVRTDIFEINTNLSLLKKALASIGASYDALQDTLKAICTESVVKECTTPKETKPAIITKDRRTLHDQKIQALVNMKHEERVTGEVQNRIAHHSNEKGDFCQYNCQFSRKKIKGLW